MPTIRADGGQRRRSDDQIAADGVVAVKVRVREAPADDHDARRARRVVVVETCRRRGVGVGERPAASRAPQRLEELGGQLSDHAGQRGVETSASAVDLRHGCRDGPGSQPTSRAAHPVSTGRRSPRPRVRRRQFADTVEQFLRDPGEPRVRIVLQALLPALRIGWRTASRARATRRTGFTSMSATKLRARSVAPVSSTSDRATSAATSARGLCGGRPSRSSARAARLARCPDVRRRA